MKASNIKRLKDSSYFNGFTYKVYSAKGEKVFDTELSAMNFASELNAPCRVIILVKLLFNSVHQKEIFLCANTDLREDIHISFNNSVEIACSNALFLYGKLAHTMSGFKTKSIFQNR